MTIFSALSACMALALVSVANARERRFKELTEADMTDAQRRVYREIATGPRGGVRGPFNALLRSPELADRVQKVGEYIRFESSLPARINEFAILITARHWNAQFEWYAHHSLAIKAGLDPDIVADLAQGKRPAGMKDDEAAVFDFCRELHEKKSVSDASYMAALDKLGERGIVDLIGVSGYYTLVSMVLNVERHPLPEGVAPPLQPLG
jgi:4-carboxymuconolactone decarboxylase